MIRCAPWQIILSVLAIATTPALAGSFDDIPAIDLSDTEVGCTKSPCFISLLGEIGPGQVSSIERKLSTRPPGAFVTLMIAGPGGDVESAMKIGRILRKNAPIMATVPPSTSCASACVLALVGATTRLVGGQVGIHRPYTTAHRSNDNLQTRQATLRSTEAGIRSYLAEMNVPESLLDEMLRYDAGSLHIMSSDELSRFRITGTDYVWQDLQDSRAAARYGIDKATYLRRGSQAEKECIREDSSPAAFTKQFECTDAILRGKSRSAAR